MWPTLRACAEPSSPTPVCLPARPGGYVGYVIPGVNGWVSADPGELRAVLANGALLQVCAGMRVGGRVRGVQAAGVRVAGGSAAALQDKVKGAARGTARGGSGFAQQSHRAGREAREDDDGKRSALAPPPTPARSAAQSAVGRRYSAHGGGGG